MHPFKLQQFPPPAHNPKAILDSTVENAFLNYQEILSTEEATRKILQDLRLKLESQE